MRRSPWILDKMVTLLLNWVLDLGGGPDVYDFYDDPNGAVLNEKLNQDGLDQLLKHGHILSVTERDELPDRLFSLVIEGPEGRMRKYARNDLANTAVSTIYFLEKWRDLPAPAVKVAAANLMEGCHWYGLDVPPQLEKLALDPITSTFAFLSARDAAKRGALKKQQFLRAAGLPGSSAPGLAKAAGAEAGIEPYVEVTRDTPTAGDLIDWELAGVTTSRVKTGSLQDFYDAIRMYEDSRVGWAPEQKVAFCRPLASWAEDLGLLAEMPEDARQYGNVKQADAEYITAMLETRAPYFREPKEYVEYLTKVAEITESSEGDELATKLAEYERQVYLSEYWGDGVPDPWRMVYGMTKTGLRNIPETEYTHGSGDQAISGPQIRDLAAHHRKELLNYFDDEFVNAFQIDPLAIFDSLPLDHKRAITRIYKKVKEKK